MLNVNRHGIYIYIFLNFRFENRPFFFSLSISFFPFSIYLPLSLLLSVGFYVFVSVFLSFLPLSDISLGTRLRYSLVVDEDVKKPHKQTNKQTYK